MVATNRNLAQPKDIARIGEEAVLNNLKHQGWTGIAVTADRDIQANNPGGTLQLFRLKVAAHPNTPDSLSDAERAILISKAKSMNAVAYEVKVQLDEKHTTATIRYRLL